MLSNDWSDHTVLGGSIALTIPEKFFIEGSSHFSQFLDDYAFGIGYEIGRYVPGWRVAFPVQIGYRHAECLHAFPETHSSTVRETLEMVILGGRIMATQQWEYLGIELGIYSHVGIPFHREFNRPPERELFHANLWFDIGAFIGFTLSPGDS